MDRLIVAVSAPDLVAIALKMELAAERSDGDVASAYATAISADSLRLVGRAEIAIAAPGGDGVGA